MDWKLELVPIPVTDVDRAKAFYAENVGFDLDHDVGGGEGMRVVQLTPPGSAYSIVLGIGIVDSKPGSVQGLHLVVPEIEAAREAARAELVERGVEATEAQPFGDSRDGDATVFFCFFDDPDGNGWAVQEIRARRGTSRRVL